MSLEQENQQLRAVLAQLRQTSPYHLRHEQQGKAKRSVSALVDRMYCDPGCQHERRYKQLLLRSSPVLEHLL